MCRFLIKIFFIYILFVNASFGQVINNIEISGNKRISKETIEVLSGIKKNENINNQIINESIKELYKTNFFSDINFSINQNTLKINLIENPIIENIEFTGFKNKSLIQIIEENMLLKRRSTFNDYSLQTDINTIENILKSSGYYFANVKTSIDKNNEQNSIKLIVDINQGKRARIKNIIFLGDKKIKDKRLLEIISSEEHHFWKFLSKKVYLNQSLINLDKRLLENFYKNQGFYKVKIYDTYAEMNKDGYFNLTYNIDAGNKYTFNDLKLFLPEDYDHLNFNTLNKLFKSLKNETYSLDMINQILFEIDKIASSRLYDFIDATVEEEIIDNNKINFKFRINDSEKFYVETINILGNFNTIEDVLRNNLIIDEGDPLNNLLYNKSIDRIKSLGIFKKVNSEIIDGSNSNLKIINIDVEEQPTGEISLGAGVGTSGSVVSGSIVEKNFLGTGSRLSSNIEFSDNHIKGQVFYSKPNFANTDNTLTSSIKSVTTDNLSDFGYEISELGFSIGAESEIFEQIYFSPEIEISFEDLKTNNLANAALKKQEGSYKDLYLNYGLTNDLRDSLFRPKDGYITSFYQELPLVSDNSELSNTFVHTSYKTLNSDNDMIGKASFYFKSIHSISNNDVRISNRVNIPESRLRGFEKSKIGPTDSTGFVGGNYASSLNLSTTLPGILPTVEILDFSYFIDIGNVWGVDYDESINDSNIIRSSTGISLDFLTPIGPLNFSLSQPLTKKSTDKTQTFRFNLGTTF
jgi:outer membrane protein insertion porin family